MFLLSSPLKIVSDITQPIVAGLYTDEYKKYDLQEFTLTGDKIIQGVTSDEMCAKSCSSNPDFRCESFDYCTDGSCILRKLHKFTASSGPLQAFSCSHYSRNHLYDYILRDHKTLQIQFDSVAKVSSAAECADLCSSGTGLPGCATFTLCSVERGDKQLSFYDNTRSTLIIADTFCQIVSAASSVSTTRSSSGSSISSTLSTTTTTTTTTTSSSSSAAPSSTTPSSVTDNGLCSSDADSSDTGPRVGIAFGTLFLGLLIGALCVFLFMRNHINKPLVQDIQMLKTLKN
uniref:Apple domain-containing protein n=1 Tax=Biomphalaria glabrata TaxID=6526 RepID=A0A2C9M7I1_BIOGL